MKISNTFTVEIRFILISSLGGILLVLLGLNIGWIIGPLIMAAVLSFKQPNWFKNPANPNKGISPHWVRIGQTILAVQLGQKINISVLATFKDHWITITIMLLLSVVFSLLSGLVIWKFSRTDMITSFFATAPGGIVAMPSLADDAGANTGVVSIVQTMRVFLVVMIIPLIVATWIAPVVNHTTTNVGLITTVPQFELGHLVGTILLFLAAWGGKFIGKKLKFPSPVLIGGMLSVAIVQSLYILIVGTELLIWWPAIILIIAQVLMGASIGSRFQRSMFQGIGKVILVAFISTIGLIIAMLLCAFIVSYITGIPLITSVLAFAPGGIAEMAATAIVLNADSTFVVAVQVLRIVVVLLVLPPIFKLLNNHQKVQQKQNDSEISV
jgi:membrane AbrB-like protein